MVLSYGQTNCSNDLALFDRSTLSPKVLVRVVRRVGVGVIALLGCGPNNALMRLIGG